MNKSISVIITGATGDAGSGVLDACIKDSRVQKITTITRKPLPIKNEKVVQKSTKNGTSIIGDHNSPLWLLSPPLLNGGGFFIFLYSDITHIWD